MGVFTNRAIAASLLATVAFTSVAFDATPVEAGQSKTAKDRAFAAGKQACINLGNEQGVEPFPESRLAFSTNGQIGCTFTLAANGGTPFKKHFDLGNQRDYDAYSKLYANAVTKEDRAAEREDRAAERAEEQARRNDPVAQVQKRAGRQVQSRINRAIDSAIKGALDNIFN